MEWEKKLTIDKDYLSELTNFVSRSLCGKCMKRFEILEDKNMIKSDIRELVYEEFRHLRSLIEAHSRGLNVKQFNFKSREKKPTQ